MLPPIDFDAFRQGVQKIIDAKELAESGSQSKQSVYTFPPGLMGEMWTSFIVLLPARFLRWRWPVQSD